MKTPKPVRLPSGSWFVRLRLGGKSIPITEPTEKAATRKAQTIKADYLSGKRLAMVAGEDKTLAAIVKTYIDSKRPVLSPSTVNGYTCISKTRFQAYMGRVASTIDAQRMINDETKHCSPKTLKSSWALVAAAMAYAGLPVPTVRLPQIVQKERPWLDADQIRTFLDAVRGEECEAAALLALHGLRRSELLRLEYKDIDLKKGTIRVEGSLVCGEKNQYVEKATNKNRSSRRTVPIMIPRLTDLIAAAVKSGKAGKIVTCSPNTTWDRINRVCDNAGLPRVGVHGLRHSFASLAYHVGLSEHETMLLGGWSDYSTMHKIYTHIADKDLIAAKNKMSAFYNPPPPAAEDAKAKNANEKANGT